MRFARPADGFEIRLAPTVAKLIAAASEVNPAFRRFWGDIEERLKFTAHREGVPEPRLGNGFRLLVSDGAPTENRPRVVIGYLVLGDAVNVTLLRIGN